MGPDATEATAAPPPEASAPAAASAAPKEAGKPKEVSQERQRREIERVVSNILYRGSKRANEKEAGGTALSDGERQLQALILIGEAKGRLEFDDDLIVKEVTIGKTGKGTEIKKPGVLKYADYASDSELNCHFDTPTGEKPELKLSRGEVAWEHMRTHADAILSNFEGMEQEAVRQYITLRENPGSPLPEETRDLIMKLASEQGMLTIDDLIEHTQSVEAQSSTSPEQQAETAETVNALNEIKARAEGNLLDREAFREVFIARGYTPEKVQGDLEEAKAILKTIEERAKTYPKDKVIQEQLLKTRIQVSVLEQSTTAFDEGGIMDQFFTKMDKGEIPQEQAKKFADMFRKGDLKGIIEEGVNKELPEDKREELKKTLLDIAKKGGILSLFLMIILGTGAENFKGVVSLEQR